MRRRMKMRTRMTRNGTMKTAMVIMGSGYVSETVICLNSGHHNVIGKGTACWKC
jgi:hypothetical protein